jgi:hypothetical protein
MVGVHLEFWGGSILDWSFSVNKAKGRIPALHRYFYQYPPFIAKIVVELRCLSIVFVGFMFSRLLLL